MDWQLNFAVHEGHFTKEEVETIREHTTDRFFKEKVEKEQEQIKSLVDQFKNYQKLLQEEVKGNGNEDSIIERLNLVIDYLEEKGIPIKPEGHKGAFYRHLEHDSLVFKNNMYYWNSRQEKGVGAISFAMVYYDMSFPEAVTDVNNGHYIENARKRREQREHEKSNEPFKYPFYLEVNDRDAIKVYLEKERKIDGRLVDWLIKKDLIVQDKKKNVVFKWRENGGKGEIVGADRQGTVKLDNKRGSFKQILANGKEHSGFTIDIGEPNKIVAFECPIDMLSYWSIKKKELIDARLVSMSGLKPKTIMQSHIDATKEAIKSKNGCLPSITIRGGYPLSKK